MNIHDPQRSITSPLSTMLKKQAAQSWKNSMLWKLSVRKDTEASAVNVRFSVANPKSRSRGQNLQVLRKAFLLHSKRLC